MSRSLWFKRIVVALLIPSVSGCASFWRPYIVGEKLDNDVEIAPDAKARFAGDIDAAFEAANEQRNLYLAAVNNHSTGRTIASSALYFLSAWTVYKGVVTDSTAARRNLALGTTLGAATYAFGNWFSNPPAEAAYLHAYRGITCAMWQMRPYLMTLPDYAGFKGRAASLGTDVLAFDLHFEKLQSQERQFRELATPREMEKIKSEFAAAARARTRVYAAMNNAVRYSARLDNAGFTLRRRVELIAASVNEEVQRHEPQLERIDSLISQFTNQINRSVEALRPDPLNLRDDNEFAPAVSETPNPPPAAAGAAAPVAGGGGGPGANLDSKIKQLEKKLTDITKAGKADKDQTLKKLKSEIDLLKGQINALLKRPSTAGAAVIARVEQKVRDGSEALVSAVDFAKKRLDLQQEKATLLASVRWVENDLRRAYTLAVGKNVEQCRVTSTSLLTVTPPDEEVSMGVSSEQKFTILGGNGVPKVFLSGDKGSGDSEVGISTAADNGVVSVTVKTKTKVPANPAYLLITDGPGKQREDVRINFIQPKPDSAAEPAAQPAPAPKPAPKPMPNAAPVPTTATSSASVIATVPATPAAATAPPTAPAAGAKHFK